MGPHSFSSIPYSSVGCWVRSLARPHLLGCPPFAVAGFSFLSLVVVVGPHYRCWMLVVVTFPSSLHTHSHWECGCVVRYAGSWPVAVVIRYAVVFGCRCGFWMSLWCRCGFGVSSWFRVVVEALMHHFILVVGLHMSAGRNGRQKRTTTNVVARVS